MGNVLNSGERGAHTVPQEPWWSPDISRVPAVNLPALCSQLRPCVEEGVALACTDTIWLSAQDFLCWCLT